MKRLLLFAFAVLCLGGNAWAQNEFRCTVTVSTATTITAVGGDCAAPGPRLRHYITGIVASSSAAASTSADAMMTLKYGTGTTCGTGTTVFWLALQEANTTVVHSPIVPPIRVAYNSDLCWINSVAGTKTWVITGYFAP